MTKETALLAAVSLFWCGVAASQATADLPDYDVERQCQKQAAMMGGSNFMLKACLEQEQEAYDQLKRDWPTLSAATKRTCRAQAMYLPTYFMLQACVIQEIESKAAVEKFKFKK